MNMIYVQLFTCLCSYRSVELIHQHVKTESFVWKCNFFYFEIYDAQFKSAASQPAAVFQPVRDVAALKSNPVRCNCPGLGGLVLLDGQLRGWICCWPLPPTSFASGCCCAVSGCTFTNTGNQDDTFITHTASYQSGPHHLERTHLYRHESVQQQSALPDCSDSDADQMLSVSALSSLYILTALLSQETWGHNMFYLYNVQREQGVFVFWMSCRLMWWFCVCSVICVLWTTQPATPH